MKRFMNFMMYACGVLFTAGVLASLVGMACSATLFGIGAIVMFSSAVLGGLFYEEANK